MGRFSGKVESQAGQLAGVPSGVTFNGYFAAIVAGSAANFKMRRVILGVRAGATVPTSQQVSVAIYRQSVRVVGSGFTTVVMQNRDPRGAASAITGIDITNAAAAGTTGPTIGANALDELTFNTQSNYDVPFELLDEWICDQGTANGIAFVNIGNPLPSAHFLTLDITEEE
jgi:hypothetical protein